MDGQMLSIAIPSANRVGKMYEFNVMQTSAFVVIVGDTRHELEVISRPRSVQVAVLTKGMPVNTSAVGIVDTCVPATLITLRTIVSLTTASAGVIHHIPTVVCI